MSRTSGMEQLRTFAWTMESGVAQLECAVSLFAILRESYLLNVQFNK